MSNLTIIPAADHPAPQDLRRLSEGFILAQSDENPGLLTLVGPGGDLVAVFNLDQHGVALTRCTTA